MKIKLRNTCLLIFAFFSLLFLHGNGKKTKAWQPVAISNIVVTPKNGGINPDAFYYEIKGMVEAGSNACAAEGVEVKLEQKTEGSAIYITALKDDSKKNKERICTMDYNPVVKELFIKVMGFKSKTPEIVIKNVDEMNKDRSALSFLPK
jgi:hypothetical protein